MYETQNWHKATSYWIKLNTFVFITIETNNNELEKHKWAYGFCKDFFTMERRRGIFSWKIQYHQSEWIQKIWWKSREKVGESPRSHLTERVIRNIQVRHFNEHFCPLSAVQGLFSGEWNSKGKARRLCRIVIVFIWQKAETEELSPLD